jgi:hypothetical protein
VRCRGRGRADERLERGVAADEQRELVAEEQARDERHRVRERVDLVQRVELEPRRRVVGRFSDLAIPADGRVFIAVKQSPRSTPSTVAESDGA